jgi:hypothetical protein
MKISQYGIFSKKRKKGIKMDREELLRQLRPISRLAKERDSADRQISELEQKRVRALKEKDKGISIPETAADAEKTFMDKAVRQAEEKIKKIKRWVWLIAVLALLSTGIYAMISVVTGTSNHLDSIFGKTGSGVLGIMIFLPLIAAGISLFCFHLIKKGNMGFLGNCICWIFGIGCTLEAVMYAAILIFFAGLPAGVLYLCFGGALAAILISKRKAWQERFIEDYKQKAMSSSEWSDAVSADCETKAKNTQRRAEARERKNRQVQEEVERIDRQLRELRAKYKEVDEKLMACTVYPYRKLSVIDRVIRRLEDMLANTLQEALLQVEEIMRKEAKDRERALREGQEAAAARQRSWEAAQAQAAHNSRMESEARRMADEAKRAADELEEIRRRQEG